MLLKSTTEKLFMHYFQNMLSASPLDPTGVSLQDPAGGGFRIPGNVSKFIEIL